VERTGIVVQTETRLLDARAGDDELAAQRAALIETALGKALDGDSVSLWKLLDRLMPAPRGRPVRLDLPALRTIDDVEQAQIALGVALSGGRVTPAEAALINKGVIEPRRKAIETVELARRIAALEQRRAP
jgi:hypothetical protein